jgi:hypothetical protein
MALMAHTFPAPADFLESRLDESRTESLYVESRWARADALKHLNLLMTKVKNLQPIISARGVSPALSASSNMPRQSGTDARLPSLAHSPGLQLP